MSQIMTAVGLSAPLARLFLVEPGFPAFLFKRLTFSFDRPVSYVEYTMRGEMAFDDTFTPVIDPGDFSVDCS
jgi:DNA-binding GntR family transcriptional regulator